ncbi:MAG TPA: TRAM domain-containing protein, partial [Pedococcus sp.]|nr:TRAM domain-containing protein [Pedococcus sp.]
MTSAEVGGELAVGDEVEVQVGPVAHGGHCVARHEGRVVFVRHTLPGERVRVRITEAKTGQRFVRGDAVEVLAASEHRVSPPCP